MNILSFWSCPNNHIVLDCYMPQSGTVCNVVGCEGKREHFKTKDLLGMYAAVNELLIIIWGEDPNSSTDLFCTPEVIKVEQMLTRHCKEVKDFDCEENQTWSEDA